MPQAVVVDDETAAREPCRPDGAEARTGSHRFGAKRPAPLQITQHVVHGDREVVVGPCGLRRPAGHRDLDAPLEIVQPLQILFPQANTADVVQCACPDLVET